MLLIGITLWVIGAAGLGISIADLAINGRTITKSPGMVFAISVLALAFSTGYFNHAATLHDGDSASIDCVMVEKWRETSGEYGWPPDSTGVHCDSGSEQ